MSEPAPLPTATPPGWYPEPVTRRYRWWDGIQWAFYDPNAPAAAAAAPVGPTPTNPYAGVVYPARYRRPTNGMATASLVLGIVGLVACTFVIPSVLAVVFGIIGVRTASQLGGTGKGKAIWGLSLGAAVLFVLTVALAINVIV